MIIEIFLFLLAGIIAGTITGLIPGIHINLIGALLISAIFLPFQKIYLVVFIVSMSITHTFIDFIPSIFLGCPDTDTELSTLPGHQMLQEGKGYEAILLTAYGSLAAITILAVISYPSISIIQKIFPLIKKFIPYILILASILLISLENKKMKALEIFLLTGLLGYSISFLEINQPLLPLLTGLFGSSIIINSIKTNSKIPSQKITQPEINLKKPLTAAIISAPLCSFLPGLGSGQAAVIGNLITKEDTKGFMSLLGAINTLVMGFSIVTLFAIQKTRTGTAAFLKEILSSLDSKYFLLILFVIILSGVISFFITEKIARYLSKKIEKVNYKRLLISTLIFLTIIILIISGIKGVFIFIVSTLMGLYALKFKIRRTNMMGSLMVPSILWSLGFN